MIYKDYPEYFDKEAQALIKNGEDFFNFPSLHFVKSTDESKKLDTDKTPKIIIAGSGMSNGGKIVFHERAYLPYESTTLLIVGFQVKGTLGRMLKEGSKTARIMGEEVEVNAQIQSIESYSAHADQKRLLFWINEFEPKIKKIFLVHGEPEAKDVLKHKIEDETGLGVAIPSENEVFEL